MRKFLVAIFICIAITLTGCSKLTLNEYSADIVKMELVETIGVDLDGEEVVVTASVESIDLEKGSKILTARGATVAGALEKLSVLSTKERVFIDHTNHYVIGESAALRGVEKYLDFVERDMNMRISTPVYIVKNQNAGEVMNDLVDEGANISLSLETINKGLNFLSDSYVFTCADVAKNLMETGNALIPAVKLEKNEAVNGTVLAPDGYAVLKEGKLVKYIDNELAAGVNIFLSEMKPGIIEVLNEEGKNAAFQIKLDECSVKPIYSNGNLEQVDVEVSISATIDELNEGIDIYDERVLHYFSEQISNVILKKGQEVIKLSQAMASDFLDLGRKVKIKAPIQYASLEETWSDIFPELEIKLSVETEIMRTYFITQPISD